MYLIIYHKNVFAGDFHWSSIVIKMKTNEWGRKKGSLNVRHRLGAWLHCHGDLKGITFKHQADQVRYPCLCLHITNMETAAVAGECCWSCNMFAYRLFFPLRPQLSVAFWSRLGKKRLTVATREWGAFLFNFYSRILAISAA